MDLRDLVHNLVLMILLLVPTTLGKNNACNETLKISSTPASCEESLRLLFSNSDGTALAKYDDFDLFMRQEEKEASRVNGSCFSFYGTKYISIEYTCVCINLGRHFLIAHLTRNDVTCYSNYTEVPRIQSNLPHDTNMSTKPIKSTSPPTRGGMATNLSATTSGYPASATKNTPTAIGAPDKEEAPPVGNTNDRPVSAVTAQAVGLPVTPTTRAVKESVYQVTLINKTRIDTCENCILIHSKEPYIYCMFNGSIKPSLYVDNIKRNLGLMHTTRGSSLYRYVIPITHKTPLDNFHRQSVECNVTDPATKRTFKDTAKLYVTVEEKPRLNFTHIDGRRLVECSAEGRPAPLLTIQNEPLTNFTVEDNTTLPSTTYDSDEMSISKILLKYQCNSLAVFVKCCTTRMKCDTKLLQICEAHSIWPTTAPTTKPITTTLPTEGTVPTSSRITGTFSTGFTISTSKASQTPVVQTEVPVTVNITSGVEIANGVTMGNPSREWILPATIGGVVGGGLFVMAMATVAVLLIKKWIPKQKAPLGNVNQFNNAVEGPMADVDTGDVGYDAATYANVLPSTSVTLGEGDTEMEERPSKMSGSGDKELTYIDIDFSNKQPVSNTGNSMKEEPVDYVSVDFNLTKNLQQNTLN